MTIAEKQILDYTIIDALHRQIRHLDLGDFKAFGSYFAEDGEWTRRGETLKGRQSIIKTTSKRSSTLIIRHCFTNHIIDVIDENTVALVALMSGARTDLGEPAKGPVPFTSRVIAEYHDIWIKTDEGWKVKSRVFKPILIEGEK